MQWSVVATFAGVLVAASAAAWGIVREQSVVRQLERLTAILKDIGEDEPSRAHLEFVRTDLAERLNTNYRAPREWLASFIGWTLRLAAWASFVIAYAAIAATLIAQIPKPVRDGGPGTIIMVALLNAAVGGASLLLAAAFFRRRRVRRQRWLDDHQSDEVSGR